jgi:F-type H+-transporting ATPase subunit epsilon
MSKAQGFKVRVITPSGVFLETLADSVKLPSSDGEMGVLPLHTAYAGLIGDGTLQIDSDKGVTSVAIKGGISRFESNTLTLLVDSATAQ